MEIASTNIVLGIIIWIAVVVGGIVLQIFLSRRESRWPGLVLPAITFICSIVNVLGLTLYIGGAAASWITMSIYTFLLMNIPTAVLMAVYAICREKSKRRREMDRMNIQDL